MQLCSIYFLRHSYRLSVNFCIIKNVGSLSLVDRRELEQEFRKKRRTREKYEKREKHGKNFKNKKREKIEIFEKRGKHNKNLNYKKLREKH